MTALVEIAIEALVASVRGAARRGQPLRKAEAVALLRAAGLPRDQARRLVATAGDGHWTVGRGQTTSRGGCPPQILLPVAAAVCGDLEAAKTHPNQHPQPVDLRARLLAAARAAGFPRLEIRCQVVILDGEHWWQRFAALAIPIEITTALRALGVAVDAEYSTP